MTDNDLLASLHTAIVDALKGYEEAVRDAERSELRKIFRRVKLVHEKAHVELHHILLARGLKPNDGGSFMSTVHKTVISVRSALTGLDEESLSAFAEGEERIVRDYDEAIASNIDDAPVVGLLQRQKAALQNEIIDMKAIAGA